jgi:hypothetical protein
MECVFHVSYGHLPDWAEKRSVRPSVGDLISHDGRGYLVLSCACWSARRKTTFVALTNPVVDELDELWRSS